MEPFCIRDTKPQYMNGQRHNSGDDKLKVPGQTEPGGDIGRLWTKEKGGYNG